MTLYDLEVRKGVKVPQLREFISSHTFLIQIGEILPSDVRKDWTDFLAGEGIITHKVEGIQHFDKILAVLKKKYLGHELRASMSTTEAPPPKPKTKTLLAEASCDSDSDSESDSAPPKKEGAKKKMHAATSSPGKPKNLIRRKVRLPSPRPRPSL